MTLRNFSSTAIQTTLVGGITASGTSVVVAATTGFPAAPYILCLEPGTANQELVLVTGVAGTTLTVTRGYDSTTGVSHNSGAVVQHSHAAIEFREANAHVNATSGVHGVAGTLVGATDTQTLTNKTVALGSNTVSGTKAQFDTACTDADFASLAGTETLTNKTLTSPALTTPVIGGSTLTRILAGTGSCTFTAEAGPVSSAVSFGVTFTSAPKVSLGGQNNTTIFWATAITTTGFTLNARQFDSVARTITPTCDWIAIN